MAYLLKKKNFFLTDGRSHGRTNGRTVRLYYAPNLIWGYKKYVQSLDSLEVMAKVQA